MGLIHQLKRRGEITQHEAEIYELKLRTALDIGKTVRVGDLLREWHTRTNLSDAIEACVQERETLWADPVLKGTLGDIARGSALLFLGAGFSINPDTGEGLLGRSIVNELHTQLVSSGYTQLKSNDPLPKIATAWKRRWPGEIDDALARLCKASIPHAPCIQHHLLASLGCFPFIVTTNWDRLIEQAFAENHQRTSQGFEVVQDDIGATKLNFSRTSLIKLHGDYDPGAGRFAVKPKICDDDIGTLERSHPLLFKLLETLFLSQRIVVIGFRTDDYNFQKLIDVVINNIPQGRDNPTIAIVDPAQDVPTPPQSAKANYQHIRLAADEFLSDAIEWVRREHGSSGVAVRSKGQRVGASRIWAPRPCQMAETILECFEHVNRVEVVSSDPKNIIVSQKALGRRAQRVLWELTQDGSHIAVSCGSSLAALAGSRECVPLSRHREIRISSTSVLLKDVHDSHSPAGLATALADSFNAYGRKVARAHSYQLPVSLAPYLVPPELAKYVPAAHARDIEGLEQDVANYLSEVSDAEIFVLGVGASDSSTSALLEYGIGCLEACSNLDDEERGSEGKKQHRVLKYYKKMSEQFGFIGDIMYSPFVDKTAVDRVVVEMSECFLTRERLVSCLESVDKEPRTPLFKEFAARLHSHARSVPVQQVRKATMANDRHVMLVAAGVVKWRAIWSLLIAGIGDVLVIDHAIAEQLARRSKQALEAR